MTTKTKTTPPDDLLSFARFTLETLSRMTTDDFARGADKVIRERARAILEIEEG